MTITYLNHSGFFVELDRVCLLFDYWRGRLPEPVAGKTLLAFASHSHHDHYNEEIFDLVDQMIDACGQDLKNALVIFCLCFAAVDETITREEGAYIAKLLA